MGKRRKFKDNETVVINKYRNSEINREGRVVCRNKNGTYWVANMNMPFAGTVSADFKVEELSKIKGKS